MKNSITIAVPAFNEEENLERAVNRYESIVKEIFRDYELILFDDGSTDRTGVIADSIAAKNHKVRVVHNGKNKGLGYNYRTAVSMSNKEYFISLSGEGDAVAESVKRILLSAGKADIVTSYIENNEVRHWIRRVISYFFTYSINSLFGLKLRYYNGYVLQKTRILREVKMTTNSFAYQAEILVRLLKSGKNYSYIEIPYLTEATTGSSCFRIKNLLGVAMTVLALFIDIHFRSVKQNADKV